MTASSFNQVCISRGALQHNYRLLQKKTGTTVRLLAMVKADAYGHGMEDAAAAFAEAGCQDFGVAELNEGVRLRESGVQGNIFVFLGFDIAETDTFFHYDLIPVIFDYLSAEALSHAAVRLNRRMSIHLKVDCGMSRLGVLPAELSGIVAQIKELPGIYLQGICSHFPKSDEPDCSHTSTQNEKFAQLTAPFLKNIDLHLHTANSGGILYFPSTQYDMVRAGISLYGYYPDGKAGVEKAKNSKLRPAMTFLTRVLQVKTVPPGTGVSYGHTHTTIGETRIAVLPVGYEDGFSRVLSNKAEVLIGGSRAPVIGRVCMNLTMVDVSHISDVEPGSEVIILGRQESEAIDGDDIAQWMGSISYEVLCLIGNNNERKYQK